MFDIGKMMQIGQLLEEGIKTLAAKLDKIIELLERIADRDSLND